nr:MAG TPA: hypothetical protein [Caudoviricetes sp.]
MEICCTSISLTEATNINIKIWITEINQFTIY